MFMIHLLWTTVFVCIVLFLIAWARWKKIYRRAVSTNASPKLDIATICLPNGTFMVRKHLQVLVEEAQQNTVSIHVVLLDILVFQVGTKI